LATVQKFEKPAHRLSEANRGLSSCGHVKTRLVIYLGLELLLAAVISAIPCMCTRRDEARALVAWRINPTAETKAELDRQRRITFRKHVVFAGALFAGMAVITIPVIVGLSRRKVHER
jgi:hypothetical protein